MTGEGCGAWFSRLVGLLVDVVVRLGLLRLVLQLRHRRGVEAEGDEQIFEEVAVDAVRLAAPWRGAR